MKNIIYFFLILFYSTSSVLAESSPADIDYDGHVGLFDLVIMKSEYGKPDLDLCVPAPVLKTGQSTCYEGDAPFDSIPCEGTGQDGEYQMGLALPSLRFTDNGDGTVSDNMTGLMWLKDANCIETNYPEFDYEREQDGMVTWLKALNFISGINNGLYSLCGGNSPYADWRLPNIRELESLLDYGENKPALPSGHPFYHFNYNYYDVYWSSTTHPFWDNQCALGIDFNAGTSTYYNKYEIDLPYLYLVTLNVWPVRGGND